MKKSGKMDPILPGSSEEFKEINNFDDLELTEEELSDVEHNPMLFMKNQTDLNDLEMNDLVVSCEEERSIEPI